MLTLLCDVECMEQGVGQTSAAQRSVKIKTKSKTMGEWRKIGKFSLQALKIEGGTYMQ